MMANGDHPRSFGGAVRAGYLKGGCPRCGAPCLFDGWIAFADACRGCGLDLTQFNVGDGPAAFLTLIVGTLVTILAIALELSVSPPFWVHFMLWVPLTLGLVLVCLRLAKAMLLTQEYRRSAAEGKIAPVAPRAE